MSKRNKYLYSLMSPLMSDEPDWSIFADDSSIYLCPDTDIIYTCLI